MLDLAVNGYTAEQVIDALHGRSGSRGKVTFRYELLSKEDVKLGELAVQSGRVSMNSLAEIKRTASFELTEQEAQDVDWLNDRIRPVFCLKMPEIRKTYKAWGKIDASFSRSSIAYLSDGTPVPANVPRFEPGKFGKAIMVEEGTRNLISNPKFEDGLSGWTVGRYLDVAVEDSDCPIASKHAAVTLINSPSNYWFYVSQIDIVPSETYTVSLWAKIPKGLAVGINLHDVTHNSTSIITVTGNGTWQKYTHVRTFSEDTTKAGVYLYHKGDVDTTFYVTAVQLEAKPYATSFIDGTRAAETLTIPTEGVLNPQEGTVECWLYIPYGIGQYVYSRSFLGTSHLGNYFLISVTPSGRIRFASLPSDFSSSNTVIYDDWNHVALRWNSQGRDIFLNGVKTTSTGVIPAIDKDLLYIGSGVDGYQLNGLIDDLRISSRARTDAEILAAYQSGQPAPVDEWTTAKFDFDNRLTGEYFTIVNDSKPVQWIEWPLGVFLLSSPTRKNENRQVKRSIEAYDSSLILKEDKFTDRYTIAAGTKYTDAVIDLLNGAGIWKVNIIDHPGTLATDREFEIGTEKLYAVNELLAAINYTSLWVDENGYFVAQPYVLPSSRDPEYEYRTDDLSIIHPGGTEELDLFSVPNKWVRYVSNPDRAVILRSEYVNDLSTSPTSTINRGRTIVDIDSVEDIYDQATLDEYVKRIAYSASQVYGKFDFVTALMPHHSYYNCLFVEYKDLNIAHKYMESSWSMDLQPGGAMTHSCRRVIII